ncbi:MAG: LOG family protein [Thiotrichaceae bacterium]|nr:LOG family protein [Thiotrichaceae bacterium]
MDTLITPKEHLAVLSKLEVERLLDRSQGGLHSIFRNCALAVMTHGNYTDNARELLDRNQAFDIYIIPQARGIKLKVKNAPASAFVDGKIIQGINEHLFSVLRDIIFASDTILDNPKFNLESTTGITNAVFHVLRNAHALRPTSPPNMIVCWGGHSIKPIEYAYTKEVGYQLGLRELNICTGCGPGAMKGPMKGAQTGHAKQRYEKGQYLGITEPGIIAAESPNPIVNDLVILPDIEKRLEAFIRIGHGFIVFPGGVGTTEEILYILGILLHPKNAFMPFPLLFTAAEESREYFSQIDAFIGETLGEEAQKRYEIIIGDPEQVAQKMAKGMKKVKTFRKEYHDAYYYNWLLTIAPEFQQPFIPTHENMANLQLDQNQPSHKLAANLRCAFSGIVSGNVKEDGIQAIEEHGLFELSGDPKIMQRMDALLKSFIHQGRMKLPGTTYTPCYKIINAK